MIQVYLNTSEFNKISELLPDICPEVKFILKAQDDNLVKIGLAESAPCIIEFDTSVEDFYDMLDTLNDIEIDAVRLINDDIDSILMDLQIETYLKEKIADIIFSEEPISKKRIGIRKLKKSGLSKEYVNLFLKLLEYISEF